MEEVGDGGGTAAETAQVPTSNPNITYLDAPAEDEGDGTIPGVDLSAIEAGTQTFEWDQASDRSLGMTTRSYASSAPGFDWPEDGERSDRERFDRTSLLKTANARLWSTERVQLWVPEVEHDERNIHFVENPKEMPSYILAKQARQAKLQARLEKASGWKKQPKPIVSSRSEPALATARSSGSGMPTNRPATSESAPHSDVGGATSTWQGNPAHNLSRYRTRRRGKLAAQFGVKSRVLGSWAEDQKLELQRRIKQLREEPSARRQRKLKKQLEAFKAQMQPVPPAKHPRLAHSTVLFWSKHPKLGPLRFDEFDSLAPSISLHPTPVTETKMMRKPGSTKKVRVQVTADIHDKASVTLTRPIAEAMRGTQPVQRFATFEERRVAPPLPPARLPPMLHEALEQYIDEQVALTGSKRWKEDAAQPLQTAVDSLWLSQKVHAVAIPVQAVIRGFLVRQWWHRVCDAALLLHTMARGFLARRRCKYLVVARWDVIAEVVQHLILPRAILHVVEPHVQAIRTRQTMYRVLRAWADHAKLLRVAASLFGMKTVAFTRRAFQGWVDATARRRKNKRIIRRLRQMRDHRLMAEVMGAWQPWAHRQHRLKLFTRRMLLSNVVFYLETWKEDIATRKRASSAIGALFRGHLFRRRAHAATEIQRIGRGYMGKRFVQRRRAYKRFAAAALAQAIIRGFVGRLRAARKRRLLMKQEARRQVREEEHVDRGELVAREKALLFIQTKEGKAAIKQESARLQAAVDAKVQEALEASRARAQARAQGQEVQVTAESKAQVERRARLQVYFSMFDMDGGGTIDRQELAALVRGALEQDMNEAKLDALMARLDADGSGAVEFEEFAEWWESDVLPKQQKRSKNAFKRGFFNAKKFIKKKLGQTGMLLAAKQVVISRMQQESREVRRREFRETFPPPMACPRCERAFALHRQYLEHECPAVTTLARPGSMHAKLKRGHSAKEKELFAPERLYPNVQRKMDLDTFVNQAPENYEIHRKEMIGDATFGNMKATKSSRRMVATAEHVALEESLARERAQREKDIAEYKARVLANQKAGAGVGAGAGSG